MDVILTNLHCFYDTPEIVPPINLDIPGKGVPSDHSGVILATPHTNSTLPPKTHKIRRDIRPVPESLLLEFSQKLSETDFSNTLLQENSNAMVTCFENQMNKMVEETFPLKTILISNDDQVWFNEVLRALKESQAQKV